MIMCSVPLLLLLLQPPFCVIEKEDKTKNTLKHESYYYHSVENRGMNNHLVYSLSVLFNLLRSAEAAKICTIVEPLYSGQVGLHGGLFVHQQISRVVALCVGVSKAPPSIL